MTRCARFSPLRTRYAVNVIMKSRDMGGCIVSLGHDEVWAENYASTENSLFIYVFFVTRLCNTVEKFISLSFAASSSSSSSPDFALHRVASRQI